MASIVEKHGIGEVIDYNVESLNEAITKLIRNRNSQREMALKEHMLYRSMYSWSEMELRILSLYKNI